MRVKANKARHRAQFSRTAQKTKKINILPNVSRGGIRL